MPRRTTTSASRDGDHWSWSWKLGARLSCAKLVVGVATIVMKKADGGVTPDGGWIVRSNEPLVLPPGGIAEIVWNIPRAVAGGPIGVDRNGFVDM
jgi:hypothetical protein